MKIVNFSGGIGNQMFQYALLVALRETFHDETLMDTSYYGLKEMHNGFELARVFNITAKEATAEQINKLSHYFPSYKLARFYWKFLPKRRLLRKRSLLKARRKLRSNTRSLLSLESRSIFGFGRLSF